LQKINADRETAMSGFPRNPSVGDTNGFLTWTGDGWSCGGDPAGGDVPSVGPQGPPGQPATIAVGTVNTGTPTSITNVGTNQDAVLNFVIEPGPQGIPGANGQDGAPGADGATGPAGPAGSSIGVTDGSDAAPGEVGEYKEFFVGPISGGTGASLIAIVLTPGDWAVTAMLYGTWNMAGATTPISGYLNADIVADDRPATEYTGNNYSRMYSLTTTFKINTSIPLARISTDVSTDTTNLRLEYYYQFLDGSGAILPTLGQVYATVRAWRMR